MPDCFYRVLLRLWRRLRRLRRQLRQAQLDNARLTEERDVREEYIKTLKDQVANRRCQGCGEQWPEW
jgi:hypothetical protein